ncbi:MAG: endonuclease/exonuclease/phosphatase family protein [Bacteroidia bacterium]|nr:endonuclease/exonuclease/phosphatase family protein [Bacteroidia bacterium]
MNLRIVLLLLTSICFDVLAQPAKNLCVAFYNQENLFDTIDTPDKNDSEFLPGGKYNWDHEKYKNKIGNMSRVIAAMNKNNGPDFLGMCEVENDIALHDLALQLNSKNLNYKYIWFDSPDERGIDNALIYKPENIKHVKSALFLIDTNGIGGDQTRGILMADFILINKARLVLFVNHWPSRRDGETESEFKRIFVAKTLKHLCDSIEKADPYCKIIVMGDLNDYPDNKSVNEIMMAKKDAVNLPATAFYNPMFALMESGGGSYKHKNTWNFLDQILLNKNLVSNKSNLVYINNSATTFKENWMLETDDKYKGNPKRTFGGTKYLNGFSDHLPVLLYLQMK